MLQRIQNLALNLELNQILSSFIAGYLLFSANGGEVAFSFFFLRNKFVLFLYNKAT